MASFFADADQFDAAFDEATVARQQRGGRPRVNVQRDAQLVRAVEAAVRDHGLPRALDNGVHPKRTAFLEAARAVKRNFGWRISEHAVRVAYYRHQRLAHIRHRHWQAWEVL